MRRAVLFTAIVALGGCTDGRIESARKSIQAGLYDPESAQFRSEEVMKTGAVCGEMNAKNKMGGYVGFTQYAAFKMSAGWIGLKGAGRDAALVRAICSPDIEQVKRGLLSRTDRAEWFVLVDNDGNADGVISKVQALGYPARTGPSGGIYAGPFSSEADADIAQVLIALEADMLSDVKQWAF